MSAHALVAPSGMELTMACAASLLLQCLVLPQPDTDEEAEGGAAHWHAVQWAMGREMPVGYPFQHGGRNWVVDLDMVNGSKKFAYYCVRGALGRYEDPVEIPWLHPDSWGTPDYWLHRPLELIDVTDYKYGHRYVEAFENFQCMAYVIGVATRCKVLEQDDLPVVIRIVQPRAYHRDGPMREWHTTLGNVKRHMAIMAARVLVALAPSAPTTVGKHCLDCRARHLCKTLQYGSMAVVQFTGLGEAVDMPTDALGAEGRILHDALKVLTARYEGIKAQIESLMRNGKDVPYWIMEPGQSRLSWNSDVTPEIVEALGLAVNAPLLKAREPVTPTQAVAAGVLPETIAAFATRGPTGRSLKIDNNQTARKVFGVQT